MVDIKKSQRISLQEFNKALRNFKMDYLKEQEINRLFNMFDKYREGYMNYREFICAIRVIFSL